MLPSALPPWDDQRPPPLPVRRFTVEEYRRLAESGILTEDPSGPAAAPGYARRDVHAPGEPVSLRMGDTSASVDPAHLLPRGSTSVSGTSSVCGEAQARSE